MAMPTDEQNERLTCPVCDETYLFQGVTVETVNTVMKTVVFYASTFKGVDSIERDESVAIGPQDLDNLSIWRCDGCGLIIPRDVAEEIERDWMPDYPKEEVIL